MTTIQIRDVPDDVRDTLAERAKQSGQSLSAFLRDVVVREAGFARNRLLLEDVVRERSARFTVEDVLAARDAERR
jgi:plasmid stability protein